MIDLVIDLPSIGKMEMAKLGPWTLDVWETIDAGSKFKVVINTPIKDLWDINAIAGAQDKTVGTLSWWMGWGDESAEKPQRRAFRIGRLRVLAHGDVTTITILATDLSVDLKRTRGRQVFREKTVAEIVEAIAKRHGMKSEVVSSETPYTLRQCGLSDWDFLHRVVLPRDNASPGLFYVRDGDTLVLREREAEEPKHIFTHNAKILSTDTKAIRPNKMWSDLVIDESYSGGLNVAFDTAKDPGAPFSQEFLANDKTYDYNHFGAEDVPVIGSAPGKIVPVIVERGLNVARELRARSCWDAPFHTVRTAVHCPPSPHVQIGETAKVDVRGQDSSYQAFTSGLGLVYAVYHRIRLLGSATETFVFVERRGVTK